MMSLLAKVLGTASLTPRMTKQIPSLSHSLVSFLLKFVREKMVVAFSLGIIYHRSNEYKNNLVISFFIYFICRRKCN